MVFGILRQNKEKHKESLIRSSSFIQARELNKWLTDEIPWVEIRIDGSIIDVSDKFLSIFGYSKCELLNSNYNKLCSDKHKISTDYYNFLRKLKFGETFQNTYPRITKNGSTVWLSSFCIPQKRIDELDSVLELSVDITNSKKFELMHSSVSRAMDRSLLVVNFDTQGNVIHANNNFLQTFSLKCNELTDLVHRDFCKNITQREYEDFWRQLNKGVYHQGLFKRYDRHDNDIWLEATYNPVFNENGVLVSIIKIASNVTERVHTTSNLQLAVKDAASHLEETSRDCINNIQSNNSISAILYNSVDDASEIMKELDEQAGDILNIVSTVNELAKQTNLLALNASIESCRAGSHGRGFSVVADEIRNLATRTRNSIIEIEKLVISHRQVSSDLFDKIEYIKKTSINANEVLDVSKKIAIRLQEASNELNIFLGKLKSND